MGDSISSGYGVPYEFSWLPITLDAIPCSITHLNLSAQGATTQDGITALEGFIKKHQARQIIIELGGNDALRGLSIDGIKNRLSKLIEHAQSTQAQTYLVETDLPNNYGPKYKSAYRSIFKTLSETYNTPVIYLPYPEQQQYIQNDGIHPTQQGHKLISEIMIPYIKALCSDSIDLKYEIPQYK